MRLTRQEVDFGRTSVVRSPASVLEQQLEDVVVRLATADCITLDAAGRLVTSTVTTEGVVTSAAIDSPLQNLAIYRQLMLTGYLGTATAPLTLPAGPLNTAARGLGAASDKTGKVSVDMVVYLNQILGLTDETVTTFLPKKCIEVKEEVKGVVQTGPEVLPRLRAHGRKLLPIAAQRTSGRCPLRPIFPPARLRLAGSSIWLCWIRHYPRFGIAQGPILDAVPELFADPAWMGSSIGGFAQAADDARAVIDFMHSWPVPGDYATPLTCAASGETHYDVSISDDVRPAGAGAHGGRHGRQGIHPDRRERGSGCSDGHRPADGHRRDRSLHPDLPADLQLHARSGDESELDRGFQH